MKKIFKYNRHSFLRLSNVLKNNFSHKEDFKLNPNQDVYYSQLILPYELRSEMPISFRFKLKLTLSHENDCTMLRIDVKILKFYFFAFLLFAFLSFISYQVHSITWLNFFWIGPIMILDISFRSKINEEIYIVEQKITKKINQIN